MPLMINKCRLIPLCLFISFMFRVEVTSQPSNPWLATSTQGMLGAHVKAFTQGKGGDMVLMSRHTIYRSSDWGGSWFKASQGLPAHKDSIFCLAANRNGDLFVGTNDGVYRSLDNGTSWQKRNKGIERLKIEVLFVDSTGVVFAGSYAQIFRSMDTSNSWTETGAEIPIQYKNGLPQFRYSYRDGIRVSFGSWIFGTKNLGASWSQVSPTNSGSDYYGTEYYYDVKSTINAGIIFKSVYGMTAKVEQTDVSSDIQTDFHQSKIANAYESELQEWQVTFYKGHQYSGLLAVRGDSVLVGSCDHGIVKMGICGNCDNDSNNGAGRFVNYGLRNLSVTCLYRASNNYIFCGTRGGGAYFSTNEGESWQESLTGLTEPSVYDLMLPPSGSNRMLAATGSGVYVSKDGGLSWTRKISGASDYLTFCLEYTQKGTLLAGTENGVMRSLDSGETWISVKGPVLDFQDIYTAPTPYRGIGDFHVFDNNTIIAATTSGAYLSRDDGKTWAFRGPSYAMPGYEGRQYSFAWDSTTSTLYIPVITNLLASTDTAKTCQKITLPSGLYSVATIQDSKTLFIAGGTNVLSVDLKAKPLIVNSIKGNLSFKPQECAFQAIKSDPLGHLMLGSMSRGTFFSNDGGTTWIEWNTGMFEKDVLGFVQDANYHLYALTANNGIYRSERPTASLAVPELVSPIVDSTTSSRTLNFEWKSVPDAQRYNLQASTDSTFSKVEIDDKTVQTLTKQVTFSNPGVYYWRVRATRGSLLSPWSTIRRLEIQSALPAKVELVSPVRDSVFNTATVLLQWKSAARADNYSIQVANDTTFATQHTNATGVASLGVQSNTLTSNTNYYWRVQALNSQGVGEWSDTWPFRTGEIISSVQDDGVDELSLAPNPATDKVEILFHSKATPCHIVIRDMQGRELLQSTTQQTDVSMLVNGLYACEIKGAEHTVRRLITISR